jgi:hypothetical protein
MKRMIEKRRGKVSGKRSWDQPDLARMDGVVAPGVLSAMRAADRILTKAGIPHAVIGGLAVGAYGHPRATRDADFLVGDAAFVRRGGVLRMRPEVPIEVRGVAIDTVWASSSDEEVGISLAVLSHGVRVVPLEVLIAMKVRARRAQDDADVVGLLRAGADEDTVRAALTGIDPGLVGRFDQLAGQAAFERSAR